LFGLETTGQRKTQRKEKSLPIEAGTRMKEIGSNTGNSCQYVYST
jgi:hypothetical protein